MNDLRLIDWIRVETWRVKLDSSWEWDRSKSNDIQMLFWWSFHSDALSNGHPQPKNMNSEESLYLLWFYPSSYFFVLESVFLNENRYVPKSILGCPRINKNKSMWPSWTLPDRNRQMTRQEDVRTCHLLRWCFSSKEFVCSSFPFSSLMTQVFCDT